jgi:hypothetical protein
MLQIECVDASVRTTGPDPPLYSLPLVEIPCDKLIEDHATTSLRIDG